MSDVARAAAGDWVEVERVLLEPDQRAANLPPETAATPLRMWVRGFLEADAAVGEPATVVTVTGRHVEGTVSAVNPGYFHTFGEPVPALATVGRDLRARLAAFRGARERGESR